MAARQREQPIIILAAMTADRVIGLDNALPWNLPKEYQQFLDKTRGQTVVMGRKTYEIFGEDLTSQHNIVLTRGDGTFDGAKTCSTLADAIQTAKDTRCRVYICGGASVYEQAIELEQIAQMDLSIIKEAAEGDCHFPDFDKEVWELTAREDRDGYEFHRYNRKKPEVEEEQE